MVGENKCFHGQEVVPDFQENILVTKYLLAQSHKIKMWPHCVVTANQDHFLHKVSSQLIFSFQGGGWVGVGHN